MVIMPLGIVFMEEIIKNKVYELRAKAGMTQEMLAEKVGVTRQTIIAIEKGNYTPSVLLALKLAKVFSVTVESLFSIVYE
jgi:putative transcriptional regulator